MKLDPEVRQGFDGQIEERWALRAMASAAAIEARHVVLMVEQQDGAAIEALEWAERFCQAAGLRLRVTAYSAVEGNMANAPSTTHEAVERILREAAQPGVELLIAGPLPSCSSAAQGDVAQALLRRCSRPLLFVGPAYERPLVMAATDCSDPALPVLRAAWQMAAVLGSPIVLVHNIDQTGSQLAERIGMPLSPELADVLALRSREWLEGASAMSDVVITRELDNATGVLRAADRLDAGLLVVGVKPAEQAPHGTALHILLQARRSVLFVPFARAAGVTPAPPCPLEN